MVAEKAETKIIITDGRETQYSGLLQTGVDEGGGAIMKDTRSHGRQVVVVEWIKWLCDSGKLDGAIIVGVGDTVDGMLKAVAASNRVHTAKLSRDETPDSVKRIMKRAVAKRGGVSSSFSGPTHHPKPPDAALKKAVKRARELAYKEEGQPSAKRLHDEYGKDLDLVCQWAKKQKVNVELAREAWTKLFHEMQGNQVPCQIVSGMRQPFRNIKKFINATASALAKEGVLRKAGKMSGKVVTLKDGTQCTVAEGSTLYEWVDSRAAA